MKIINIYNEKLEENIMSLSKKQLLDECKAVHKFILPYLSTLNSPITLKEKADNFFQNLMQYLGDAGEATEDMEKEVKKDGLHNNTASTERNIEFLTKKFGKESPSDIKESLEEIYKKEIKKKVTKPK
jgi:hypothetical protein